MPSPSLTAHLLSQTTSPPYLAATNHPFLRQAGEGTLPSRTLVHWLYQDRIYAAHAYPRFVGHLIAKVPFETGDLSSFGSSATREETAHRQILECLTFSLVNIVREVKFFEETAAKMETQADKEVECEREATRNYCAEMARIASLGTLEEGLVFLWAMEKASCITCYKIGRQMYLDSWTFASKQTKKQEFPDGLEEFLKNWTSDEFKKFVDDLEKLVDLMNIEGGSHSWRRAEAVWNRVIELEEAFWPKI